MAVSQETVVEPDPSVCMNCGQPATQYTTTRGAVTRYFCDACGMKAYPGNTGQLRYFADDEPTEEIPDRFEAAEPAPAKKAAKTTKKATA